MRSDEDYDKWADEWAENDPSEVALGYAIKAMYWANLDENVIKSVVITMKHFMDLYSIDEAVTAYNKSPYKYLNFDEEKTNVF